MIDNLKQLILDKLLKSTLVGALATRFPKESPHYLLFWYYLCEIANPQCLVSVGGTLEIELVCCLLSRKEREVVLYEATNPRIAKNNIRCSGAKISSSKSWDLAIVDNKFSDYLDFIWSGIKLDGFMCVIDFDSKLEDFAKVNNRTLMEFELKHTVGVIQK